MRIKCVAEELVALPIISNSAIKYSNSHKQQMKALLVYYGCGCLRTAMCSREQNHWSPGRRTGVLKFGIGGRDDRKDNDAPAGGCCCAECAKECHGWEAVSGGTSQSTTHVLKWTESMGCKKPLSTQNMGSRGNVYTYSGWAGYAVTRTHQKVNVKAVVDGQQSKTFHSSIGGLADATP